MIAGFIFLRLRGILGKRTGFEGKTSPQFEKILKNINQEPQKREKTNFDERAKKDFLNGAKIAYETIITDFGDSDNKLTTSKTLLSNKVYDQFNIALSERAKRGHNAEITFIGINSAEIKEHNQNKNMLEVTVEFVSEIISCIKDKDNKVVSGDAQKVKKVLDTWKFTKDSTSKNPNWLIVDTQA